MTTHVLGICFVCRAVSPPPIAAAMKPYPPQGEAALAHRADQTMGARTCESERIMSHIAMGVRA